MLYVISKCLNVSPAGEVASPRNPAPPAGRLYYGPWEMIDLNTATAAELDGVELLRGHGFEIVRYREERGLFTSLRQLDEGPGLAQKTDGIEAHLYVEPADAI